MPTATLTNAGANLRRDAANGVAGTKPQISYVAVGTGTTTPAATDTQLVAETFRKAVTSYANGAAAGEALVTLALSSQDANGVTIQEVGWFAGNATGAANSGTLVARALYTYAKDNQHALNIVFDLTL